MKFVGCPVCGHKLLEGEANSCVQVKCNKCKSVVKVTIGDDYIKLTPLKTALTDNLTTK